MTRGHEATGGPRAGDLTPTRREVLAASGALALGGVVSTADANGSATAESVATPVLAAGDLVRPGAYVEWQVNAEASALVEHLRATVDAFEGAGSAAAAFVSTGADGVPRYVESATFADAAAWPAVGEATAAWFADRRGTTATAVRREADVAAWTVPAGEGAVDAVRLDRVADLVVLTVVGGEEAASLGPLAASRRYAAAVRGRVGSR